jgi:hypothetical protein
VAPAVDFEYLLGRDLLVVPVINPEGRAVVYLPPGGWYDWWSGERLEGPRHLRLDVPLARLPLYVRDDSLLVTAPEMEYVGQREWRPLTVDVRLASLAEASVWSPQERIELRAGRESGLRLSVDGPEMDYVVRFIEPAVRSVRASGGATVSGERVEGGVTVVEARGGRFELIARAR